MRASLRRLQCAFASVVAIAVLGAATGCDAFAEPSAEQSGDERVPNRAGTGGRGPIASPGPRPEPPPAQETPVVPPCAVAIPTVGSACSSSQLCMYTTPTPCTVVSIARCTASVWTITDIPLGQCPADIEDDAGVDDEDAGSGAAG